MTIKELYEYAKQRGIEHYDISYYDSIEGIESTNEYMIFVNDDSKEIIL